MVSQIKRIKYLFSVVGIFVLFIVLFNLYFFSKVFPGMFIAGIDIGSKDVEDAKNILDKNVRFPEKVSLNFEGQNFDIPLDSIAFAWDPVKTVNVAYSYHRTGNVFINLSRQFETLFSKTTLGISLSFDEQALSQNLALISSDLAVHPVYPKLNVVENNIFVEKGTSGSEVDQKLLRAQIGYNLSILNTSPINIPIKIINSTLSDKEAEMFKNRGEILLEKNLTLQYGQYSLTLDGKKLLSYLDPAGNYKNEELTNLTDKIAHYINREPQNSIFVFKNERVEEFTPDKDGVKVNEQVLIDTIIGNLRTLEYSDEKSIAVEIPAELTSPKVKTENINNLGIRQLLGKGVSYFKGSIPGRIYNISLASSRFKGVLVAPQETFSFNNVLGDVSSLTGYKQAYIIKDGRTVLGDGGGVCQVSTTLFRALLDSGLQVVERKAHSYRVGYYEQNSPVGLDATVFAPTADLKFKNDTPAYILIQPTFDANKSMLVFEIYGTSDGRKSYVSKPTISGTTPPPEDLYTDDPTLPAGTIKQIDYKAWGAKVSFDYKVTKNNETLFEKTFYSNYRPWQAVYLRGTGPGR
ncbi:MAG: VanW family protein [bacterium]|nr:VanW family protein [bacterium]